LEENSSVRGKFISKENIEVRFTLAKIIVKEDHQISLKI